MRKLICAVLSIFVILSLSACSKGNTSSNKDSVDIEYFSKLGKMPECDYSLGENVNKVKDELSADYENASSSEEKFYNVTEGEKSVLIDSGTFSYYYMKENENNGISYIVNYGKAFGFEPGTVSIEIKNALTDFTLIEEDISEDSVFFLAGATGGSILKYNGDDNVIIFVFQDNSLYATAIYDPANWNL